MLGDPVYNPLTQKTNFSFNSKTASNATIAFVYIYVAVFGLTWACVAWVYPPELFNTGSRSKFARIFSTSGKTVCVKLYEFRPCNLHDICNKLVCGKHYIPLIYQGSLY